MHLVIPTRSMAKWQVLVGTSSELRKSQILTWPLEFADATWSCLRNNGQHMEPLSALAYVLRGAEKCKDDSD